MVVSDQSSGQLYKMSMSGMGGHWQSDASGNPYVQNKNVGIGTTPSSTIRLKVSGNTVIENSTNDAELYLTPGSNKWAEIWMGHSGSTVKGLIKYQNDDNSMHFWANNTPILELTSQDVIIPANKRLINNGTLRVIGESTFKDDVSIDEADLYVRKNISTNVGGNLM